MWKSNIEEWSKVSLDAYRFSFEQGQNRLNTIISDGEKITSKCYAIISILTPLLSICIGTLINYIHRKEFGFEICVAIIGGLIYTKCLYSLFRLITSRAEHYSYIEPQSIFNKNQLEHPGLTEPNQIKSLLFNEMQHLQSKIEFNKKVNRTRIKTFDSCLITSLIITVTLIAFIFTLLIF